MGGTGRSLYVSCTGIERRGDCVNGLERTNDFLNLTNAWLRLFEPADDLTRGEALPSSVDKSPLESVCFLFNISGFSSYSGVSDDNDCNTGSDIDSGVDDI